MCYDKFSTYVSQYTFASAFDLDKPVSIPEHERSIRLMAQACLMQWLDKEYINKNFMVKCALLSVC